MLLAERGWNYEYRGSFRRQAHDLAASHLLAKRMPASSICLLGEEMHPLSRETLSMFRSLNTAIFDQFGSLTTGQPDVDTCPEEATVFIRLYSRRLPSEAFNRDLQSINHRFGIGMSGQAQEILSPAQAVTFFGKKGQATHILVLQPRKRELSEQQKRFFRSLMIEELYQTYSFGIDIFKTGVGGPFASKLQESFTNLRSRSWLSPDFMEGLLSSNPDGLCLFDLMMLHAIHEVPENVSASDAFISFVSKNFAKLVASAEQTMADQAVAALLDPMCEGVEP